MENAFIESFNGRLRDECLNVHQFVSLAEPGDLRDVNRPRPVRALVHRRHGSHEDENFGRAGVWTSVFAARRQRTQAEIRQPPEGLEPALKAAGLRHFTVHSLRHFNASVLIQRETPITEVAARLGHASPAVTMAIYAHWLRQAKGEATNAIGDALRDARNG